MCWKKFFEKFQEGCLLHDHLWYLSGMKEAFQSVFLPDPSNEVFAHENIWFGGRCCFTNFKMSI